MPTVAIVEGVKVQFFAEEHSPPHFHVAFAEYRAQIKIDDLQVLNGHMPPAKLKVGIILGSDTAAGFDEGLGSGHCEAPSGEDRMKDMLRVTSAEAVIPGVLKVAWNDGFEGVVDLHGLIAKGKIFSPLRDPRYFEKVQVAPYGHSVFWGEEDNEDVDFGCDRLREMVEEQAALIAKAS